jgi:hypothetical protein
MNLRYLAVPLLSAWAVLGATPASAQLYPIQPIQPLPLPQVQPVPSQLTQPQYYPPAPVTNPYPMPQIQQPLNCTSSRVGTFTYTNCY